jgi:uncharacterized membrane protein
VSKSAKGSIEVEAPIERIYDYWKTLENLPHFMSNVEEVRSTGPDTTHWVVKGPLGAKLEFDAKRTEMEPGRGIGWHAVNGELMTGGEASFEEVAPGRTRVDVTMNYADPPPGGKLGGTAANALSDPERKLREDLRNFARILEGAKTRDKEAVIRLLEEWEAEGSTYDEETLPELKEALDRDRPSYRKLFAG